MFIGCRSPLLLGNTPQIEVDKGKFEHVHTQPLVTLPPRTRAHRTDRTQQRLCRRQTPLPLLPILSLDCVSAPTITTHGSSPFSHAKLAHPLDLVSECAQRRALHAVSGTAALFARRRRWEHP
jgi:hypothetical protein